MILIGPVLDREEASRILTLGETLSCFEYLGERPHEEVQKFIAASDVFLNTSLNEGMPGAVLEAMAMGFRFSPVTLPETVPWWSMGKMACSFPPVIQRIWSTPP